MTAVPSRVVVTGMGAVSAAGWGLGALREALASGETALGPFSRFDHKRQRTHVAGEVPGGPGPGFLRPPDWARLSYADRFALFAAREATDAAALERPLEGAGVFFGTSTGGLLEGEWFLEEILERPSSRGRLGLMASHQLNAPADAVARHLGATGPVETFSSACASAALAIERARRALEAREVDVALAGGSDSLCSITYTGFNALRSLDEVPCRPFREGRTGLTLGEGGAMLVLERAEDALLRGAKPVAELLGAGASCDASHMTAPRPEGEGAAAAIESALADGGVSKDEVHHINAHGTGTPLNDAAEWAAFERAFGPRAAAIPVSATKSILGHLLGSAGAIEAVALVLCLARREAHPAPGGEPVDPALGVDLVFGKPRPLAEDAVGVSTSLGFGGANAALAFRAWRG